MKLGNWMKKWSFLLCLLLTGILFFAWTGQWQVYAQPFCKSAEWCKGQWEFWQEKRPVGEASEGQKQEAVMGNVTATEDTTGKEALQPGEETVEPPGRDSFFTQGKAEERNEAVYHTVGNDYFEDAVFIGDSRTVGLYEYGGLEETAAFYASTGLTIYKMFDAPIVPDDSGRQKLTIEEALTQKQFGKIYLMIGINEMGTGTVDSFMEAYEKAVEHLKELQPDAVIYLQAIMKVTAERSAQGDYITNDGIEARNERIAKLADDQTVFYLDVNPLLCDETGGMTASYTYDGVHLKAQYISIWLDFLKNHAVDKVLLD